MTHEIAKKAGRVIAFEVDTRFRNSLMRLPRNVDVHFGDIHTYLSFGGKRRNRREFNKIISNPPYKIIEWFLHKLIFLEYDKVILLVPKRFVYSARVNPVFSSFFNIVVKDEVSKKNFYPIPGSDSMIIDLQKLLDPVKTKDLSLFLRQFLYQHEKQKSRNALREGLIRYVQSTEGIMLTKNDARKIIDKRGIERALLDRFPDNPEIYQAVDGAFKNKLSSGASS